MEQDKDQNQDNERRNTYLKNRIWRVGFGDGLVERCSLPGFEDIEAEENAKIRQAAEERKNGGKSSGVTKDDIDQALQRLKENGLSSREEIYARNEITIETPLGTFKRNLMPSPERFNEICREVMRDMRLKSEL